MPYIGMFTEEKVQAAIDKAGEKLGDGESGLVLHVDDKDEISLAVIKRFGEKVSVETALVYDGSFGHFEKEKLSFEANLIVKWK